MGLFANNESLSSALTEFYGTVGTRLKFFQQAQRDVDRYLATRFSVFDYVDPDENQLSDIIGDLLNPEGKHGQAALFLNLFLSAIDPKLVYLKTPVRILRELPTIDVPIWPGMTTEHLMCGALILRSLISASVKPFTANFAAL